jgi:hypothetical protein
MTMANIEDLERGHAALLRRVEQLEERLATTEPSVVPVGGVLAFVGTLDQARALRPQGWWVCDGTEVDSPGSPYHGKPLPDLRDRFLRGADAAGTRGGSNRATVPGQAIDSATYGFGGGPLHQDPRVTVWNSQAWQSGAPLLSRGQFHAVGVDIDNPPYTTVIYICRVR